MPILFHNKNQSRIIVKKIVGVFYFVLILLTTYFIRSCELSNQKQKETENNIRKNIEESQNKKNDTKSYSLEDPKARHKLNSAHKNKKEFEFICASHKKAGININHPILVIIIHGLIMQKDTCESKKNFRKIVKTLKFKYPINKLKILFIELGDSVNMKIKTQAIKAYVTLKKYIKKEYLSDNTPIICIGHSAGGLVCYKLYNNYKKLNIKGIVTLSTPWRGTQLAKNKTKFRFPIRWILNILNHTYSITKNGVKDVTVDSSFLKWLKKSIKTCTIPIWAIGGNTEYYSKIFSINWLKNFCFSENCTEQNLFGTVKHDGVVPLCSQLGIGIENIKSIRINESVNHSVDIRLMLHNIAIKILHVLGNFCPIKMQNKLLSIKYEKSITESKLAINTIVSFINQYGFGITFKSNNDAA